MYLLDTNVVSELRRRRPHGAVVAWLQSVDEAHLNIAAITLGEIQTGIELSRMRDPMKAAEIEKWLDALAATYNIIAMDGAILRCCARMMHRQNASLLEDAMIAATAQIGNLIVVTRNISDFSVFQSRVFDPFTFS